MRSETGTKSAKVQGVLIGFIAGWGMAGLLILGGIVLCFTGIGAIIGIPLIFGGLLAPILGPLMGLGAIKGECPWCETQVTSSITAKGVDCPACNNRIVIKDRKFVKIG